VRGERREGVGMVLEYEATRRRLLRGDGEVMVRAMRREDIPAVRRYDDELTATPAEYNANLRPGGWSGRRRRTCRG